MNLTVTAGGDGRWELGLAGEGHLQRPEVYKALEPVVKAADAIGV